MITQASGSEEVRIFMPSTCKELRLSVVQVDKTLDFAYLRCKL